MTYVAKFDMSAARVKALIAQAQQRLDVKVHLEHNIKRLELLPLKAVLCALEKGKDSDIKRPVWIEGYGSVTSEVAHTLTLHIDKLKALK